MNQPLILPVETGVAPGDSAIREAVTALEHGLLVILPTETVYGIAADSRNPEAERRLFLAKRRPAGKPIVLLVGDASQVERCGGELGSAGLALAGRYWPGPLTLVVPVERGTGYACFEGFRVPDHPAALAVLSAAGFPLRTTSANMAGEPPAMDAAEAVKAVGRSVSVAIDAGPVSGGVPSTVLKLDGEKFIVLREGAIPIREISAACEQLGLKSEKMGAEMNNADSTDANDGGGRRILFICTGNVCRSPMAEYLLRHHLGRDSSWKIESAGTHAFEGVSASRHAVEVLRELGIDLTLHRSRGLTADLVRSARLVVAMTAAHAEEVKRRFSEASGKVVLLKSFDKDSRGGDIHDPIGESKEIYDNICREIDEALLDLILYLKAQRQ